MSIRRKQKPDTVKLNFVSIKKGSTSLPTISKLQVPIVSSATTVSNDRDVTSDNWDVPETTAAAAAAATIETNDNQPINSRHRSYKVREEKLAEAWASVREDIFTSVVESASFSSQLCHLCGEDAVVMCGQCGPYVLYCYSCARQMHMKVNLFHKLLYWQVCPSICFDAYVGHILY